MMLVAVASLMVDGRQRGKGTGVLGTIQASFGLDTLSL